MAIFYLVDRTNNMGSRASGRYRGSGRTGLQERREARGVAKNIARQIAIDVGDASARDVVVVDDDGTELSKTPSRALANPGSMVRSAPRPNPQRANCRIPISIFLSLIGRLPCLWTCGRRTKPLGRVSVRRRCLARKLWISLAISCDGPAKLRVSFSASDSD